MAAYEIAEIACKDQLVFIYGSVEAGMKLLGTREFEKMVLAIEEALEKFTAQEPERV